jgi:transcriptional regulator with PAS, ATPase and Fis domain
MMRSYSWPGNVRELQNVIERWAIVSASSDVAMSQTWFAREVLQGAPTDHEQAPDGTVDFREYLATIERNLIGRAMTAAGGNQSEAARRLGLSRGSLLERLRKYGSNTARHGRRVPTRECDCGSRRDGVSGATREEGSRGRGSYADDRRG